MYQNLPNSEMDWSIEGRLVCRVVGARCYGDVSSIVGHFATHLASNYHAVLDAEMGLVPEGPVQPMTQPRPATPPPTTPPSSPTMELSPPKPKATRFRWMNAEPSPMSSPVSMPATLPLPDPMSMAILSAQPASLYPRDMVIPDSEEDREERKTKRRRNAGIARGTMVSFGCIICTNTLAEVCVCWVSYRR
ncbi:hypothetical protein EDB80DRAFT_209606 [Ilyonectria destructans]|nr:hypothetical protein EDB80DRAFT_209606 [Ilyonectria destructans]